MNILFVTDKWCDGRPDLSLSHMFQNIFNTFSQCRSEDSFSTIHLDESSIVYDIHIDDVLIKYCDRWKVDAIMFSLLGNSNLNPSLSVYDKLKKMGICLCFFWPDADNNTIQKINSLQGMSDLHISLDNATSDFHDNMIRNSNHINLAVPMDKNMFYNQKIKDIDVSFIGSPRYRDRQIFLNHLISNVPNIYIGGGQREEGLSPEKYSELIRRSKIGINFSIDPRGYFQTKGRVYEILASCSMLLEFKNSSTARMFSPGIDYVEFDSLEDIVDKINYYLENDEEREKIASAGHRTYNEKYSSQIIWDTIMNKITEQEISYI